MEPFDQGVWMEPFGQVILREPCGPHSVHTVGEISSFLGEVKIWGWAQVRDGEMELEMMSSESC